MATDPLDEAVERLCKWHAIPIDSDKHEFRVTVEQYRAILLDYRKKVLEPIRAMVNKQAEDEGLWFVAQTAPEAYLQQELRALHVTIEGRTEIECALRALAEES
jgi:hypothetical protein